MSGLGPCFPIRSPAPPTHLRKSGTGCCGRTSSWRPLFSLSSTRGCAPNGSLSASAFIARFCAHFFLLLKTSSASAPLPKTIAALGERVVKQSLADPHLLAQSALSPEEERLARINPRYGTSSTASRLDAFLLPDSLQFAEYNAESPAGLGYAETLANVFLTLPVMQRFSEHYNVRKFPLMKLMLAALLESYREWGGSASPPVIAIVDWREVPTWSEFEIIQAHFQKEGVTTSPRRSARLWFSSRRPPHSLRPAH